MTPSVVLLLCLLSATDSLPPPRISFPLNSTERPLVVFRLPDNHKTTRLLLSNDGSTLYVGAQDALFSLDVSRSDVIQLKKKVDWRPSDRELSSCHAKGRSPAECLNFVRVLEFMNSTHLYACGSYAYNPHDAFLDTESFSIIQHGSAKGRCPFSPLQRNTALVIDGELFTATTSDFRGAQPQISRHFSKDGRPDVSQDVSVSLLEEPTFVSSWLDSSDRKLYFFFNEVGKEFSFTDDLQITRVAQVCKDDVGGLRTLQKKWTSFVKASLLCQSPKQLPFNVLQDMFTLHPPDGSSDTLYYGLFTSQWSSAPQSAVCVFRLQDLRTVFAESYRTFDTRTHQWNPLMEKHSYMGKCGLGNASDSILAEVKKTFLTSSSVKSDGGAPVFVSSGRRYSRVAAMRTRAADSKQHTVLFLLTESGVLHRMVLSGQGPRVIEEIHVFTQPQPVASIVLSSSQGRLYVGTAEGVAVVPVARCSVYTTCSQCVLARDPLCGWSRSSGVCTGPDDTSDDIAQDLEKGDVGEECKGPRTASLSTEIRVGLDQAVRLQCPKPSNLARLTWTSPQFKDLPDKLFIQSPDGSLSFLATADRVGTYRCEAEEGGYKEVVKIYDVQHIAPPRSMIPGPKCDKCYESKNQDQTYKDIRTTAPAATTPSGEPDSEESDEEDPISGEESGSNDISPPDLALTPKEDGRVRKEQSDGVLRMTVKKSYYSELVVISVLLAACICVLVLATLHMWYQRRISPLVGPENGSKADPSMESVPSLSSPDETEEKVVV